MHSSDKKQQQTNKPKNYALQNPIHAYPVMKFHLRSQINQWRRETSIQERVKVETSLNNIIARAKT